MNEMRIALRNLFRQPRRTVLLALAIAVGVMIVTLINGFSGSFIENLGANYAHILAGHIFVEGAEKAESGKTYSVIRDDSLITEALTSAEVPALFITRRSEMLGTLIFEGNSVNQNITGVDWSKESFFEERIILKEGSFESLVSTPRGIILTDKTVDRLKLSLGDVVLVKTKTYTGQNTVGEFVLSAVSYDTGLFGSLSGYANRNYVNEVLNLEPDEYMSMGIYKPDGLENLDEVGERFYDELKSRVQIFERTGEEGSNPLMALMQQRQEEKWSGVRYSMSTLNDILNEIKEIIRVLDVATLVILLILFFIIMVGVTNTFRMVMFERMGEIGTMRSLGMQKPALTVLFLYEALFLALIGIASGLILAGIVMFSVHQIDWGTNSRIFMLLKNGRMTFRFTSWKMILNLVLVLGMTVFAAAIPVRRAVKMEPAEALRRIN